MIGQQAAPEVRTADEISRRSDWTVGPRRSLGSVVPARFLARGGFARDAGVLMVGTVSAQALNLAASPLLTRLYLPEQLGLLGVLMSASSVIAPLACLRFEQAIMIEKTEPGAATMLRLSLVVTAMASLLSLAVVLAVGLLAGALVDRSGLSGLLWALPLLVLLSGAYQAARSWLGRNREFGTMAGARVARAVAANGGQVGLGWAFAAGAPGLLGSFIAGTALEALLLARAVRRGAQPRDVEETPREDARALALRHRKFPLFAVPGSLSNLLAVEAPTFLLAAVFGPREVGLYWLAYRTLALPISLIGDAVSTVYYQRMAAMHARGESGAPLTTQTFVGLLVLAVLPMLALFALAPTLFGIVFGPGWEEAGAYARALIPAQLLLFAVFPLTQAFFVYERQAEGLIWNLTFLVVSGTTFALGARLGGPLASVQAYSLGAAAMYCLVALLAFRWSGGRAQSVPVYLAQAWLVKPTEEGRRHDA